MLRGMGRQRQTVPLWQALLIGPFLIAFGIWEYYRLDQLEQHGGRMVVDRFTRFFYAIGGKTTVLVVIGGIGVVYILLLANWYRATRAAERTLAAREAELADRESPAPRKERPMRKRGEVPPPPVGPTEGGPFRGHPAPTVQVVRTERQASRPEVVPGDGDDRGPSILR
jgi:hypothetical protein